MCEVFTDVGGKEKLYQVCPPVCNIIHSLKLVDYLHVQAKTHGITIRYFLVISIGNLKRVLINY